MSTCHICNRTLPNRYAVGGWAEVDGEKVAFCHLHWQERQRQVRQLSSPHTVSSTNLKTMENNPNPPADPQRSRQAMKESLRLLKKLGTGAAGLIARLRKSKTPEDMMCEMEQALNLNAGKRAEMSTRLENLYNTIATGKKALASAAPARRRVLEMELKAKLKEYQAAERTLGILLENEQTLTLVRSRLEEVHAYGMSGITEDFIDEVTERVDAAADGAEDRSDALRDLEKAGCRRERDSDEDDFLTALDAFGEPEPEPEDANETEQPKPEPQRKKDLLDDFDEPEK